LFCLENIFEIINGLSSSGEFDFGENLGFVATGYNFSALSDRFSPASEETSYGIKLDFSFGQKVRVFKHLKKDPISTLNQNFFSRKCVKTPF